MSKFSNPILFSAHFNINPEVIKSAGLIDPFLTVDTQLFIDPLLLNKSNNIIISNDAFNRFKVYFQNIIRLLAISNKEGDTPWRTAQKQLSLKEPPANGLGYGITDRSDSSRPNILRDTILRTVKEIIELGSKDPEMISLMGFFEENVGPDTISDLTSRIIEPDLANITNQFCLDHNIPVKTSSQTPLIPLPHYKKPNSKERPIVLVPLDIVRDLPIANDWSDVYNAVNSNSVIREKVNHFLAGLTKPTIIECKDAVRNAAMFSANTFEAFLKAIKENTDHYDPKDDILGYYKLKEFLSQTFEKSEKEYTIESGVDQIKSVILDTLNMFSHHIEHGNLWEALWYNNKPKKERVAQLIYFAIADCFCKANDIDISPEANMGGGPIDFKYSKGYNARVLVEMKRSNGTVVHGYEKQLEIYKDASRTQHGFFVIMYYGGLGDKLKRIQEIRDERLMRNELASEIIVIDARQKVSAIKRL